MIIIKSDLGAYVNIEQISHFIIEKDETRAEDVKRIRLMNGSGYFEHTVSGKQAELLLQALEANSIEAWSVPYIAVNYKLEK